MIPAVYCADVADGPNVRAASGPHSFVNVQPQPLGGGVCLENGESVRGFVTRLFLRVPRQIPWSTLLPADL